MGNDGYYPRYYTNPESGDFEETTKQHHDKIKALRRLTLPTFSKIGRVIIFGTGGEIKGNNNFKELFCDPTNCKKNT